MAGSSSKVTFILLFAFAITIPCLEAGIAEFDDYLRAQADRAHEIALQSYVPDPENVTAEINLHVNKYYLPVPTLLLCDDYLETQGNYVISMVLNCGYVAVTVVLRSLQPDVIILRPMRSTITV